jgi:UDP-glucose 4-epimerase
MKVLITGGCGYVGFSVLKHLVKNESIEEIILYDNLLNRNYNLFFGSSLKGIKKIKFLNCDILDNFRLQKSMENMDVVVHLAAKVSTPFSNSSSHEFDQVNNWGTSNVVSCVEKIKSVKTFIYLSSISVYGNTEGEMIDELTKTSPNTFYGISKLKAEGHVKRIAESKNVYILRSGNVFGFNPCIRMDSVINKSVFEANHYNKIEIHGNGNQKRPFVNVDFLGAYLANKCIDDSLKPGLYNIVNFNLSINEIAESVKQLYPEVDFIFVDQHLKMRSIAAKSAFDTMCEKPNKEFINQVKKLKEEFNF